MLVYRGMDIGTAKPLTSQRKKVLHHLIDLVSPRSNFSVYRYRELALKVLDKIFAKERIPLIVGGGGLYAGALWKGISKEIKESPRTQKKLEAEARSKGLSFLYEKLKKIDPLRAIEIHPNDERRILRALEIAEASGKVPTQCYQEKISLEDLGYAVRAFAIRRDRGELYNRINRRVVRMFRKGFVREVQKLRRQGFSKTARQALGYREILGLEGGHAELPEKLIQDIQKHTRQFAKRQLTWLRHQKEIHWIDWDERESAGSVCDKIMQAIRG